MFLEFMRSLVLSLLCLSGNRLAEELPPGTSGTASACFELFSDLPVIGEKA